ncbi:MAG: hypothetical protein KGH94_00345 [Candidatus Micrarchaeota archaeon]|nr:hypothetical protein [Candidatus Micrarchaeota archaeon]
MDRYIETEMITSLATIVLVILCIAVFIVYGAHALFYIAVVVTLIVGFANAWLIARGGRASEPMASPRVQKVRAKRRRRKR